MVTEQQERVSRLEGAYEQVDRRLDDMNLSIERVWTEASNIRTEMNNLRTEMNSRINNLYILIAGSWITLMGAIIGLYIKG